MAALLVLLCAGWVAKGLLERDLPEATEPVSGDEEAAAKAPVASGEVDDAPPEPDPAEAEPLLDPRQLERVGDVVKDYKAGILEGRRALAALEDIKRRHPMVADVAERHSAQIRSNLVAEGKAALERFLKGELPGLLAGGDFREATTRLSRLGRAHPFSLKDVNEEIEKVKEAARAALGKATAAALARAQAGEAAQARADLERVTRNLPASLEVERGAALEALNGVNR